MRGSVKKILLTLAVAVLGSGTVYATSTINKLFDYSSILAPGQSVPAPTPAPDAAPERYVNPYMSYEPYIYIKGGVAYDDFAGLPDFGQYGRIGGDRIAVYPVSVTKRASADSPGAVYIFESRIIDYIGVNANTLKNYKAHIKSVGFTSKKKFESAAFGEYIDLIAERLKYDPDFKADADGFFTSEDDDSFRWLLIGRSIAYDRDGELTPCVEFRFYSLTRSDAKPVSIDDGSGDTAASGIIYL